MKKAVQYSANMNASMNVSNGIGDSANGIQVFPRNNRTQL